MTDSDAPARAAEMEVTGVDQHRAWYEKTMPPVERITDRVWSIPVPVPDNPIRYTLTYLLLGDDGAVVVDPGWDTEPTWQALTAGLRHVGVDPREVSGVVITHLHPDHHGLSGRLAAVAGAWVGMHPVEGRVLAARDAVADRHADREWLARQGAPESDLVEMSPTAEQLASYAAMALPTLTLDDEALLPLSGRRIRAIATPGHTPGHLCLYDEDEDLLLTGDHVLPRISPNVGLQPSGADSPLRPYLRSLERIRRYGNAEILPAHEWRFRGLGERLDQLAAHHGERCEEILSVVAARGPLSVWELTQRLTWSRGWENVHGFQRRAALAETLAHVVYLAEDGRLTLVDSTGGTSNIGDLDSAGGPGGPTVVSVA